VRGGRRPGAGRKAGSANKLTRKIADKALAEGTTPLEYMLKLLRAEPTPDADAAEKARLEAMRFEAAKAAAPYVHPKLQAIEHKGPNNGPIKVEHFDPRDVARRMAFLLAQEAHQVDKDKAPAPKPVKKKVTIPA
jgi:hypothetical protein